MQRCRAESLVVVLLVSQLLLLLCRHEMGLTRGRLVVERVPRPGAPVACACRKYRRHSLRAIMHNQLPKRSGMARRCTC